MTNPVAGSLDANVLLRLLLNDVPDQAEAVDQLFIHAHGQFQVADTAIMEVAFVLQRNYGFTRAAVVAAIEGLMALDNLRCNQPLLKRALPLFAAHPKLSFEDCCLSVYAELQGASPLYTFDKKLANQTPGAQLVPTLSSGEGGTA